MSFQLNDDLVRSSILELIRRTSTELSPDVVDALVASRDLEDRESAAYSVLGQILDNVKLAREKSTPICQDTGTCLFYFTIPTGVSLRQIRSLTASAVEEATEKTYLRPNAVHSVSGVNSGNNIGDMFPTIYFDEWDEPYIKVSLMLKGGGSENVSAQYKLPDTTLKAGRNLDGVYKCVLDSVTRAQGLGCAPGVLGIGIGGDRSSGMSLAKKQILRVIQDENPDPQLAALESKLYTDINTLGIGPMGFGGKTTVLGVKVGQAHRLPASYFVSVAYMCWAARRQSMQLFEDRVEYA